MAWPVLLPALATRRTALPSSAEPTLALRRPAAQALAATATSTATVADTREIERRIRQQVLHALAQPGRPRDSLSQTVTEVALTPRLLQAVTERVAVALDRRASVERYRRGG
ncbi:Uncharacterised protein [Delftia tsuruhatensis]|nr:Uncharacterised protein [Delftia tsuruhatensis]CAC9682802.1 Uncharacterised protein [Delftia tsuruhatensis]